MSVKQWLSRRTYSQSKSMEDAGMSQGRRPLAWKWPILSTRRDTYGLLCEECTSQQSGRRKCPHQKIEQVQAGYTNPME
jgi:hypothetical protein